MKALGAYIFAGGFTVGVKRHFDVVGHWEGSAYGVETAALNWPGMPIVWPESAWPSNAVEPKPWHEWDIDFVYANPPCAVFSSMGIATTRGKGAWRDDPRMSCWHNAFGLVEKIKPRAWACESVTNAYTVGREMIDEMTKRALMLGYSATHLLLDAKWSGIPQSRKRFFLVLHRAPRMVGLPFNWAPPPTIGEAVAGIADPGYFTVHSRKDWPELIRETPPGERLANTWERLNPGFDSRRNAQGKVKGRPSFQDRKLNPAEVMGAWVGDKFYHWDGARAIGLEEAKAICGYPADFLVAPKDLKEFGSLLARAVMPPVGEWLARAVRATIETVPEASALGDRRVTVVDVREPGIDPRDITHMYLDERGKVRVKVRNGEAYWGTPEAEANDRRRNRDDDSVDDGEGGGGDRETAHPAGERRAADSRPPGGPRQQVVPRDRADARPPPQVRAPDPEARGTTVIPTRAEQLITPAALAGVAPTALEPAKAYTTKPRSSTAKVEGEGSGEFVRRMLMLDEHTPEQIAGLVLERFPGRKTTVKDVYWNWNRLRETGKSPPPWRGTRTPSAYPGQKKLAPGDGPAPTAVRPGDGAGRPSVAPAALAPAPAVPKPAGAPYQEARPARPLSGLQGERGPSVRTRPTRGPGARVALVEWHPRVCGSVAWAAHLASAAPAELVTFSRSGQQLAAWSGPWRWKVYPIADADDVLNDYDAVVLVDVACFAPDVTKNGKGDDAVPYYLDIARHIRAPYTGMYHGGLYQKKHDPALDASFSGPGFRGELITTRLAQARARLGERWPSLRFRHNPYLPYDPSWSNTIDPGRDRTREVLMTARIATNKGQNALLKVADRLNGNSVVRGYNAFGLPSIGHRLVELGQALGYGLASVPKLRRDKAALTHPNAPKFYTGAFSFLAPSGRRYTYGDGFDDLGDLDWAPWLHLSLPSRDFGDTLEYVTLDAIAAGLVAIVPETSTIEGKYSTLATVPYEGCSVWWDEKKGIGGRGFDEEALIGMVNALLAGSDEWLADRAAAQRREVLAKHSAAAVWADVASILGVAP